MQGRRETRGVLHVTRTTRISKWRRCSTWGHVRVGSSPFRYPKTFFFFFSFLSSLLLYISPLLLSLFLILRIALRASFSTRCHGLQSNTPKKTMPTAAARSINARTFEYLLLLLLLLFFSTPFAAELTSASAADASQIRQRRKRLTGRGTRPNGKGRNFNEPDSPKGRQRLDVRHKKRLG